MTKKILTKAEKIALRKKYKTLAIRYGWMILEMKFLYYEGPKYNFKVPSDKYYDEIEDKYKKICAKLKLEPTASNHVGWPDTPSGRLVAEHLIENKGKSKYLKKM